MHFAISSPKLFDAPKVPFSKADGKKDCSSQYMQDTYKINSGWGERNNFFKLREAVSLFKIISPAERVTGMNTCPGEMCPVPPLPPCLPAVAEAGALGPGALQAPRKARRPWLRDVAEIPPSSSGVFSSGERLRRSPLDVKRVGTQGVPTAPLYSKAQELGILWGYRS